MNREAMMVYRVSALGSSSKNVARRVVVLKGQRCKSSQRIVSGQAVLFLRERRKSCWSPSFLLSLFAGFMGMDLSGLSTSVSVRPTSTHPMHLLLKGGGGISFFSPLSHAQTQPVF